MRYSLVDQYYLASPNYPEIIGAVGQQLRLLIAETLYSQDDLSDALDRIIIADIGSSGDEGIREATRTLGSNQDYPFTAYNFGDIEILEERKNIRAALKHFFVSDLNSFVYSLPVKQEVMMITFCNNPEDYERVFKLLFEMGATETKLKVPIVINGVSTVLPVLVNVTPQKGQYAHAFQEYLRTNGIYDVVHNFELHFHDLILDSSGIALIDNFIFMVDEKSPIDDSLNNEVYRKDYSRNDLPVILTTDPVNEEPDVPIGNSVVINFNVTMDEDSVNSSITIYPYFEHKIIWDDDSKILLLQNKGNLQYNTEYTITIDKTAHAFYVRDRIEEFELKFTTEEE